MSSSLSSYRSKRNPGRTSEPMGSDTLGSGESFVIQEHHARTLHWDFRLDRDGVLISWALPKGLPLSPDENRLAVHTENHPLEYLDFQGAIPEGEYGAGSVAIWDQGTYETEKWTEREVVVVLHGDRCSGRYALFATHGNNWMIHRMDPTPEDIDPMPVAVLPMLAQTGHLPRCDDAWVYEFKWDGIRALIFVEGGRIKAQSRNQRDLSKYFPELRAIGEALGSRTAIIDGEIVAFGKTSAPSFPVLARRLHLNSKSAINRRARETPATFLAFDLLYLDGKLLFDRPYRDRRRELEALNLQGPGFATPPSVEGRKGAEVLAISAERGLEGVVAKRRDSLYSPGKRSGAWIKIKNFRTQEVVIGGWTPGKGSRQACIGALLVGIPTGDELSFVGKVGTGFDVETLRHLGEFLKRLECEQSPFREVLPALDRSRARFVVPQLVGEVQFSEWTNEHKLRHPSWRGLRPDKDPDQVVYES